MKKYHNKNLAKQRARLKPCHCGYQPHLIQEMKQYNGAYPIINYRVECNICGFFGYLYSSLPRLIKQWNRRHK